jgi:hypothetical protein
MQTSEGYFYTISTKIAIICVINEQLFNTSYNNRKRSMMIEKKEAANDN